MLLRTLEASLFQNLLISKGTKRTSEGKIRADECTVSADQYF